MPLHRVLSPIDGSVVDERRLHSNREVDAALDAAVAGGQHWRALPLEQRMRGIASAIAALESMRDVASSEVTLQMGRPLLQALREIDEAAHLGRSFVDQAAGALEVQEYAVGSSRRRRVERVPLGVVFQVATWTAPFVSAGEVLFPALLAGNAVVLRHSDQVPLSADRLAAAFAAAGIPEGVFQVLHLTQDRAARVVADPRVDLLAYAGSTLSAQPFLAAAGERAMGAVLQLGSKAPAYVRGDADVASAAEALVTSAVENGGQSLGSAERVYVHNDCYDAFIEHALACLYREVLGDPRAERTTLGPLVRRRNAECVRRQVAEAIGMGARALVDESRWGDALGGAYVAPQLLVDVHHRMGVMTEPTQGPVLGVQRVHTDEEAVALMNDSRWGHCASIWTSDPDVAMDVGNRLQTATVYVNESAGTGHILPSATANDAGRGCTLSRLGYEAVTRPKSYYFHQQVSAPKPS